MILKMDCTGESINNIYTHTHGFLIYSLFLRSFSAHRVEQVDVNSVRIRSHNPLPVRVECINFKDVIRNEAFVTTNFLELASQPNYAQKEQCPTLLIFMLQLDTSF